MFRLRVMLLLNAENDFVCFILHNKRIKRIITYNIAEQTNINTIINC
jgi:hypothetical protein